MLYVSSLTFKMYRSRTVVKVPSGLAMGQIIGKRGSNIKHLQTVACARMAVDTASGTLTISGSTSDVSRAVKLLEAQFESWRSSGDVSLAQRSTPMGAASPNVSRTPIEQSINLSFKFLSCRYCIYMLSRHWQTRVAQT